jgi:invasion protein IalB
MAACLAALLPGVARAQDSRGFCPDRLGFGHAGKTFDDWAVECERAPDGENRCLLSQTQLLKENNARLLKASIGFWGRRRSQCWCSCCHWASICVRALP